MLLVTIKVPQARARLFCAIPMPAVASRRGAAILWEARASGVRYSVKIDDGRSMGAWGLALMASGLCVLGTAAHAADPVSFNRDVRPIFSSICFKCHGPDDGARKGKFRLDQREDAIANRGGYFAIDPGNAEESEVVLRIHSTDPEEVMPPPDSGKTLTAEQKDILTRWIDEGAVYETHWSFMPPKRAPLPAVSDPAWVRNPIDAFVLARLDQEGLAPAPEADAVTLLRRAFVDIVGLPPSIEEIDAYLAGDSETGYAQAVTQLLASPHFGERWARRWLDAAQYADSDGFEKDKPRQVWAWRDWVIHALNANMPYDEFVKQQIAGDLMPGATQDHIVATGFLRNSMINEEGGIDPEQFRMEAVFNRMDVIGRAVLGLTVQCAQCHTHKYDPLTHTDYYRMLAYLNSAYEAQVTVYTPGEAEERDAVLKSLDQIDAETKAAHADWKSKLDEWTEELRARPWPEWKAVELEFDDTSSGGQKFVSLGDASYIAQGYAPTRFKPKMAGLSPASVITAVRLELLNHPNLPRGGPGRSIYGASALSEFEMRIAPADGTFEKFDDWQRVEIASAIADVNPPERELGPEFPDKDAKKVRHTGPVAMAIDGNDDTAWSIDAGPGRTNQPRYAIFLLKEPVTLEAGTRIGFRLGQNHGGYNSDDNQTNNVGRFRISVTGASELPAEAVPMDVTTIAAKPGDARTADETTRLFRYWRSVTPELAGENERAEEAWRSHPWGATQLVYRELPAPRETHRLERGDFLQPAEAVAPGAPEFLNAPDAGAPPNRLGLAEWLVSRDAPTTARAYVNRIWQGYFGEGLVTTASDFGVQGELPSHPELLDWLAVEFMDSGWDIKHIHRLIVESATYRQSSRATPESLERDPANRLLARGARYRVEGEIVRDIALAASGLLNPAIGGPSVYPPAPEFLFEPPASYGPKTWNTEDDGDQYRRALYTFRFRSVPYPALQVFDTPPGDAPCTRRERSNTPLQALTLLNEPLFVECAASLAKQTLAHVGGSDAERIAYAFRRCTARMPDSEETETLARFLDKQRTRIAAGELDPAAILGGEGSADLAAWALTTRVMLNLDETITRQ